MTDDFLPTANRLLTLALTQRSSQIVVREALEEALQVTAGLRAFLARIEPESGELVVAEVAGAGWSDTLRRLRLQPHNATQRGITGYVAITGEPYVSPDVHNDPHYLPAFTDVHSEAAVPLFDAEGRVRGILNIQSDRRNAFHADHITQLTMFANAMAVALASEEYRERERMLVEVGLDLAATTEIEPLVERVVEVAARVLRCEVCSLFLLDDASQTLILRASRGTLTQRIGDAYYRPGEGLTGSVALTGEAIRLDDPRKDPRWLGRYTEFTPDEMGAFLAVPIIGRDRVLGVLRVSRPHATPAWFHAHFTDSDERVLRTIGSQLGTAIENVRSFNRLVHTERMAAWGELSAKSAHMIGNRTFAIKGDLNELKHVLTTPPDAPVASGRDIQQEVLVLADSIEHGVFRLEEILSEFRDFVMATQLALQEADLNQVVRETVAETFPKRGHVLLQEDYAPSLPVARCDVGKLKRAFSELIENAVSFQPDGGLLRVTTTLFVPGLAPLVPGLPPTRRFVQIEFADSGPGVADEIKDRIFTPFFTSRVKGMGLGLSIVKGIIDAHHGSIRETGEPGQGAQFLIYIPV